MRCGVERQFPVPPGHAVGYRGDVMYLRQNYNQAATAGKNKNEEERSLTTATSTNNAKTQKYDIFCRLFNKKIVHNIACWLYLLIIYVLWKKYKNLMRQTSLVFDVGNEL